MKRKSTLILGTLIIIISLIIIYYTINNKEPNLIIDNREITGEEFLHVMSNEKHGVTQYFYRNYGAKVDKKFWEQEFNGEIPYEMLAEKTIEALKEIYATYGIAVEKGYLGEVGFNALLKRFKEENKSRADKIAKGEPVYGLAEFSLDLFLMYEMDSLQKMYMNDTENEGMTIPDKEAKSYYEKHRDEMFTKNDDIELEFVRIYYSLEEFSEEDVDNLRNDLIRLYRELDDDKTIDSLIGNYKNLQSYYQHINILSEEVSVKSREIGDVLELATNLEAGQSTQVIDQNGSLYLIRCVERTNYDYLPYDQVRDVVLKRLREEKYDQIVAERVEQMTIIVDKPKLYNFIRKHLR